MAGLLKTGTLQTVDELSLCFEMSCIVADCSAAVVSTMTVAADSKRPGATSLGSESSKPETVKSNTANHESL